MEKISLEEYKKYLINCYKYEFDNNEKQRLKRLEILNKKYNDEFLNNVLDGTHKFIEKIIECSENDYYGYISIPLECEPDITYIDLDLVGGCKSDTIVSDSDNNFYSVDLLKEIFGNFIINPGRDECAEEIEGDDDFCVMSFIPSYYLYIQCKKEVIDKVKNTKVLKLNQK